MKPLGRRRRAVTAALLAIVLVIAGVVIWSVHGAGEYYAISPGSAPVVSTSETCRPAGGGNLALPGGKVCVRLDVPADKNHAAGGSIMMVDVLLGQSTPWQFFLSKVGLLHRLEDGTVLESNQAVLGGAPASQMACQANQEMADAQSAASVVALRTLGYKVAETDLGARVDLVASGTPAAGAGLECNDLITSINGQSVRTADALTAAIHALLPGDVAHLVVQRAGKDGKPQTVALAVKLGTTPKAKRAADSNRAYLGVEPKTRSSYAYPFQINVDVGAIGGPSAGLALTLGLLDSLGGGQLTGGHRIAATGTMDATGDVGGVGGVQQKTVAVRRAGAQYFFVPCGNFNDTKGENGSMKVFAVPDVNQALLDLESIGGRLPTEPSTGLPIQLGPPASCPAGPTG